MHQSSIFNGVGSGHTVISWQATFVMDAIICPTGGSAARVQNGRKRAPSLRGARGRPRAVSRLGKILVRPARAAGYARASLGLRRASAAPMVATESQERPTRGQGDPRIPWGVHPQYRLYKERPAGRRPLPNTMHAGPRAQQYGRSRGSDTPPSRPRPLAGRHPGRLSMRRRRFCCALWRSPTPRTSSIWL